MEYDVRPKFNLNDKVQIYNTPDVPPLRGLVCDIEIDCCGDYIYSLTNGLNVNECYLRSPIPLTEDILNKRPNLRRIIDGCEGQTFYMVGIGCVTFLRFNHITGNANNLETFAVEVKFANTQTSMWINADGTFMDGDGTVMMFPSRELYEKCPFNPVQAWEEWYVHDFGCMWKPKAGETYWYFDRRFLIQKVCAKAVSAESTALSQFDKNNLYSGNCFPTEEMCKEAVQAISSTLRTLHRTHRTKTDKK